MSKSSMSFVQPDVLNENKMTIHYFLRQSYDEAKKQLEDGFSLIQDGVSFLKEEFSAIYEKTGQYLDRMILPVNNFLKDITQIDSELKQEIRKESTELISLNGRMVSVDQALSQPMEENY
jgi:hypothetical protein